jgi:hypothetical protein
MSEKNTTSLGGWIKKHKVASTLIAVFIFFIIIGSIGGSDENSNKNTDNQVQNSNNITNDLQPTNNQPIIKEEPKEKEWEEVFSVKTTADKQTQGFNLEGGQQKIIYKTTGGEVAACFIYVFEEGRSLEQDGGFPVVMIDGTQEDETMMRKSAGEYYLDIKTVNGSCELELQELR